MTDHVADIHQYCESVLAGTTIAGRWVQLACERHVTDMEHAHERGYVFDNRKAWEACEYFETCLQFSKGEWAGKHFVLSPPQKFQVGSVFGWVSIETGYRRFTRAFIDVARKFGKSEEAAGIALKHGSLDDPAEPGAQVFLAATKEEQVRDTSWKQCTQMAMQPALSSLFNCQKRVLLVESGPQPGSVVRIIGSDRPFAGLDLHAAILDEMHDWQPRHMPFYESMTTASGSRRQPIIWYFTTAGDDKSTLWISLRSEVCRMLEDCEAGKPTQDHLFGFIACADEDDDVFKFNAWCPELETMLRKANPNYPVTPKPEYLRQQWEDARGNPIEANKFRRFHANQRVRSHLRPILPKSWENLPKHTETEPDWPAFGGIDLGRTNDFAAWAVVWKANDRYRCIGNTYTCADRPKHLQRHDIAEWVRNGDLIEHSGDSVQLDDVERDILAVPNVTQWAFDPTFAAQLAQHIELQLGPDVPVKFYQSRRFFNEPLRKLLSLIRDGQLEIEDNECHAWQAANLGVNSGPGDLWMPEKGTDLDQSSKIDWIVALTMALGLAILQDDVAQPNFSWD